MTRPPEYSDDEEFSPPSPYDADPTDEDDLWFLPAPPEDVAPGDLPWPVAARETELDLRQWLDAEREQYRLLADTAQAVARYGERLRHAADGVSERLALMTVSALFRTEGVWLGPEQIALYRAFRLGTDDTARDLSRADWAMRRLLSGPAPQMGLRDFLGRIEVQAPREGDDRATGSSLDLLGDDWIEALSDQLHPLTRAAQGFALWRRQGLTPIDHVLEPSVAALTLGAGRAITFLPMAEGHRFDRHLGTDSAEARLTAFLSAIEAGALRALMELDRLHAWQQKAIAATQDLSGRTPPQLIAALMRHPVLSGDLVAENAGCSLPSARRNLVLFQERGLIREVTGQERYRFWTASV